MGSLTPASSKHQGLFVLLAVVHAMGIMYHLCLADCNHKGISDILFVPAGPIKTHNGVPWRL